jgi:hypothetical protein
MASGSWKRTPLGVYLSKNSASCRMADKLFHYLVRSGALWDAAEEGVDSMRMADQSSRALHR